MNEVTTILKIDAPWENDRQGVLDMLETIASVEWHRFFPDSLGDDEMQHPPLLQWRYSTRGSRIEGTPQRENALFAAVATFRGNVEWVISRPRHVASNRQTRLAAYTEKNWMLTTRTVLDRLVDNQHQIDTKILLALAEQNPDHGILANQDIPALTEHLRRAINAAQRMSASAIR